MRILKSAAAAVAVSLAAPALLAQSSAPKTDARFPLTVDSIMRGPDLVGYPPDSLRWSADSQELYFDWRKPGEDEASPYVVGRDGGPPVKLTDEQKKNAPPANRRRGKPPPRALSAARPEI